LKEISLKIKSEGNSKRSHPDSHFLPHRLEVGLANEPFRWQFRRKNEIKYWNYVTTGYNLQYVEIKIG